MPLCQSPADVAGQLHHYAPGPPCPLLSRSPYDQFLTTGGQLIQVKPTNWLLRLVCKGAADLQACRACRQTWRPLCNGVLPKGHQLGATCASHPPADYNPLLCDLHHNVVDAETQLPPHVPTGEWHGLPTRIGG